jgi:organic hydroperoxide reductase OsmC/OhrA
MSAHTAGIEWRRGDAAFTDSCYSRAHVWRFDGGVEVPASASPHVVPPPLGRADAVDPEEAFVAALASCHMLWFLSLAARRGFVVDSYSDQATGLMERDKRGRMAITRVTLRPLAVFSGPRVPDRAGLDELHHAAHEQCFIANSVRTEVFCEPQSG